MNEKAIKFFEEEITRLENAPKINGCEMTDEWAEQIKICKTAKSAIEKQIPKKPKIDNNDWISCPNCNETFAMFDSLERRLSCCGCCGQRLDWSDTE